MQLTSEQKAVLETDSDIVINAVAGSGKTTTLIEYAKTRPPYSKILYLAFNKTVKSEAVERFKAAGLTNIRVETAHSLAYDHIVKQTSYELVPMYQSHDLCQLLRVATGDRQTDFIVANHVNKFISLFCNGNATRVQDVNYAETLVESKSKSFVERQYHQIEKLTRTALARMDKAEIPMTHDFYLKKFQLISPKLSYDYILFDEGQDASPAMLDVFLKQKAVKLIVGDMHQQIYGWRYAINSLQQVNFKVHHLSHSFRFDEEIALVANKILGWKRHLSHAPAQKVVGAGKPRGVITSRATLGRTNISLLLNAIAQRQHGSIDKLFFEGNISSYTFADEGASLYDVLHLFNGSREKIKHSLIAEMKSMNDLEEYIQKTEDNSLAVVVEVVKEFGNKLPGLIAELKTHHTGNKEEAEMIFSTVHRCKGMEYDEVTLLNDFMTEEKLKKNAVEVSGDQFASTKSNRLAEEVNILYVAATRAREKLNIPGDINPLRCVGLAQPLSLTASSINKYSSRYSTCGMDDLDFYSRRFAGLEYQSKHYKRSNRGKSWTTEEVNQVEQLYRQKKAIPDIAEIMGRGENGVRMKLIDMGLM